MADDINFHLIEKPAAGPGGGGGGLFGEFMQ